MVLRSVLMIFFTGRLITFMKSFSTENYVSTQELESIVGNAGISLPQYTEVFWQERIEKAVAPGTKIDCTV